MIYLGGGDVTTEIKTGRGYVYCLHYHVVWCVKYRHNIMTKEIVDDLYKIITKIAYDNGFEILEYNTDQDHVHILISCSPQNFIPDIMKALNNMWSNCKVMTDISKVCGIAMMKHMPSSAKTSLLPMKR